MTAPITQRAGDRVRVDVELQRHQGAALAAHMRI
jgi:hypothetical protein